MPSVLPTGVALVTKYIMNSSQKTCKDKAICKNCETFLAQQSNIQQWRNQPAVDDRA